MNIEIERKFLVDNPPDLENFSSEEILQGYLLITDEKEIRIRKKGSAYFQGVKVGRGLSRQEIESEIGMFQFEELWPETEGRRIEKRRYKIYYDGILIELDVYTGKLSGLITAEVEFKSEEESRLFEPPPWFGPEVTQDDRYKNKNLALSGRIPSTHSK
jgi:adenylate cyclase